MADYCTTAQLALALPNANNLADYDGNGTDDTGVQGFWISSATRLMWSAFATCTEYATALDPATYTAGDYPDVEYMCAWLAADFGRASRGMMPVPGPEHPVMHWVQRIVDGFGQLNAA